MTEWLTSILVVAGAAWMLLAGLGALRMPDLPMRMHATTKAGALGCGLIMAGVAVHFAETAVTVRTIAIIGFITLTAPVAAHVLARAGYLVGVPLWHGVVRDDLKGRYDPDTHRLASCEAQDSSCGETS